MQEWQENCDGNSLWWNGNGSSAGFCEFSLFVSQQNYSDLYFIAVDYALKRFYKKKSVFWDQKMLKSTKAKVNKQLARESHQLQEQKIYTIHTAMDVLLYGAERVTTS